MAEVPKVSPSISKYMIGGGPLYAWTFHRLLGGIVKPPSRQMELGTVLHRMVLGRGKRFKILDYPSYQSKEAKAARDEAREAKWVPILKHKHVEARKIADRIEEWLEIYEIDLEDGDAEIELTWKEQTEHGPVECKAIADWLATDCHVIYDLKTTEATVTKESCQRALADGGAIQDAAYRSWVANTMPSLAGRVRPVFLFCQVTEPFLVLPVTCGPTMRELGDSQWTRAVHEFGKCLSRGRERKHWPGPIEAHEAPIDIEAPPWALQRELEEEY